MEKSEQIRLIQRSADGDSAAFSVLYQEYHDAIDRFCFMFLHDKAETDCIVQETFTMAFQNLDMLNNALNFEDWLKQIAADKCKDYLKQTKPALFSENDSEIRTIDSIETSKIINEIIDRLPDAQRISVVLYYYEKKTAKEIASFMECSESEIYNHLNDACKKIREETGIIEEKKHIKLHSAEISMFDMTFVPEDAYNGASQAFENADHRVSGAGYAYFAGATPSAKESFLKRLFKATASKIIAIVLSIAVLATGGTFIISKLIGSSDINNAFDSNISTKKPFSMKDKDKDSSDKPFSINDIEINEELIPYKSFETEAFYEEYLKPLMLKAGFKEDGAFVCETTRKSHYVYYKDCSAVETEYNTCGRFEIPNSRYVLGFQYTIINHSAAKDFPYDDSIHSLESWPQCYYALFFDIRAKTDNDNGNGAYGGAYGALKVFSDFSMTTGIWGNGTSTYTGYDSTATIFSSEHTTTEIYKKLKERFDDPTIKEKLLIEKQANES